MGLGLGSRFLLSAPMIYQVSYVTQFPALALGATLVLVPKSALLDELQLLINTAKVSHLYVTPSLFDVVASCDLPSLVCVILAGERVPQHQLEMWQDKVNNFVIAYGNTETVWATAMDFDNSAERAPSNIIGFPLPHVSCYVLDAHLQPLPVGVMGELYIGGDGVGRGYLNRSDLTRKAFIKNPFSSDDGSH
eukprot:381245_1